MTLDNAATLLSILGPLLALVMVYQHRRFIAYRLSGDISRLNKQEKAYFFESRSPSQEQPPQPAPASKSVPLTDEHAAQEALSHIETTLAYERRAVQTLKARPHMADLTDRLAAVDVTLNEVRESLAQKTRLKA